VKRRKYWGGAGSGFRVCVLSRGCSSAAARRLLHDADAAVELALGVVVVDVGVAAAHVGRGHGRQAARVVGATVLKQDVGALLAAGSPGVGQRGLATSVTTLHVHAVLQEKTAGMKGRSDRRLFLYIYIYI